MRTLIQLIRSFRVIFRGQKWLQMESTPCEPIAHKRIKLDVPLGEESTAKEAVNWRSRLGRAFDEVDVGITEFIGDYKPFEAVLKNRFEDFLVHEITKSGETLRLTDNGMPEEEVMPVLDIYEVLDDETIDKIKALLDDNSECDGSHAIDETLETMDGDVEELVEEEVTERSAETTVESVELKDSECHESKAVKISVNGMSKLERTRIHRAIKDNYHELETLTTDEGDDKYIVVKRFDKHSVCRRRDNPWPKNRGEFVVFVLYKENKETQQAINELALKMNVSAKNFEIAGTKDKRAVTTQAVSAWKVPPKKIWSTAKRSPAIHVGDFRFAKTGLKLGDLWGNRFDIVLRDVVCEDRQNAEQSLDALKTLGFINYYGMQRFGHQLSKPYAIGIAILRRDWELVVRLILTKKPKDMKIHNKPQLMSFNECVDLWLKTRNAQLVYKKFPFKWTPEGTLFKGLTRVAAGDYHGAICTGMHRSQRLLYLHCYQSYVWNRSASFRVKTYGLCVVAGDLLRVPAKDKAEDVGAVKERDADIVVANDEHLKWATIYDIVIPVIGSDSLMPENSVADYITATLAEEDISVDLYKQLPKQWCIYGSYRKLFVKPQDFGYEWIQYNDPNVALIESDLKSINRRTAAAIDKSGGGEDNAKSVAANTGGCDDKLCLKLSMSLPSSCYATMACRQITRTETTVLEYKSWLTSKV